MAVDVARGLAILAMAAYHFCWDLSYIRLADIPLFTHPIWLAARALILGSFLLLVGVGHALAQRNWSWPAWWRRLALVAGSALIITITSFVTFPQAFIFFGVLHCIALASVLLLAFDRLPTTVVLIVAVLAGIAPTYLAGPAFDRPWLLWLGLNTVPPASNDFVPLLPWFAVVLVGLAAGRWLAGSGAGAALLAWRSEAAAACLLAFAGRHSLVIYLLHQPLLMGGLLLWMMAAGAAPS